MMPIAPTRVSGSRTDKEYHCSVPQFSFIPSGESRELADDVRALFEDLAASLPLEQRAYSGECHPALDVLETDRAIEIVMDISGIPPEALRIVYRAGVVVIAGEKAPTPAAAEQTYHLVEREFGRFARAVRVAGAFDVAGARATARNGELTIVLPKRDERRDQLHHIAVADRSEHPERSER
jgi:HSP20 family protein